AFAELLGREDALAGISAEYAASVEQQCSRVQSVVDPGEVLTTIELDGDVAYVYPPAHDPDGRGLEPLAVPYPFFLECGLQPSPNLAPQFEGEAFLEVSLELLPDFLDDADHVVIFTEAYETVDELVAAQPIFEGITAVRGGNAYITPVLTGANYIGAQERLAAYADVLSGSTG
ncbi:MAG: hypothetical protein AAF945_08130, partial [Actinomycetota bacterium]